MAEDKNSKYYSLNASMNKYLSVFIETTFVTTEKGLKTKNDRISAVKLKL